MYLNPETLSNQSHWVPGLIELTPEQEEIYLQHNGFVLVTEDEESENGYSITPDTEKWEAWKAEQPTEDEIKSAEIREKRNILLEACDWTQTLDAPIDVQTRDEYRIYRQSLRDITEQEGFPNTVDWPEEPSRTKAAPDPVDEAFDILTGGEDNA